MADFFLGGNKMAMSIEGMGKIDYILKNLPKKLAKKAIIKAFRMGARPIVQTAKQKVPISGKKSWMTSHRHISKGVQSTKLKRKRSGDLKRSIGVIVGKVGIALWVGPSRGGRKEADGWYAHFVEFGTASTGWGKGIKKKPFMRPAWDQNNKKTLKIIENELGNQITKFFQANV